MTETRCRPLPPRLGRRAATLLGAALPDVRVHVGPEAARLGALAFACGRDVHVAPELLRAPLPVFARVLGHELAHVAQQQAGRVAPTGGRGGRAWNHDAALEHEADAFARVFVDPARHALPSCAAPVGAAAAGAALQPLVRIAGTTVQPGSDGELDLPERERRVLDLIHDGTEWLGWALHAPETFAFDDTAGLLEGVQVGLHGRPAMLLPHLRLEVSPLKLLELDEDELAVVARYEQRAGGTLDPRLRGILARHRLHPQDALAAGLRHLQSVGVASGALFQAMGLDDAIAVCELVEGLRVTPQVSKLDQREAASFAAGLARTPREFTDYYRFYLSFLERSARDRTPEAESPQVAEGRTAQAQGIVEALTPHAWEMLKCPWFEVTPGPDEVTAVVRNWVSQGLPPGFGRTSSAVYHAFVNTPLDSETAQAPAALLAEHRRELGAALAAGEARPARLSQDGLSRIFEMHTPQAVAELELGPGGLLTLERFTRHERLH
jgi:hypothetical protein